MMRPVTVRLESDVIKRLERQAHALGYSSPSQYIREVLTSHSWRDLDEIPTGLTAQPGVGDGSEESLMDPVVCREGPLPGENIQSLVHKLLQRTETKHD